METWLVPVGITVLFIAGTVSIIVTNVRQARKAKESPPAHKGKRQAQRGRVYRSGGTYRNASPSDGGTGGGY